MSEMAGMGELTDQDGMTRQEALALRVATQVRRHVAEQIAAAIDPLRAEITALRERVDTLERQAGSRDDRDDAEDQRVPHR